MFGEAEIKMVLIFFYYLLSAAAFVIFYVYVINDRQKNRHDVFDYFTCEKGGQSDQCSRHKFEGRAHVQMYLRLILYLPFSLLPLFKIIIFTLNINCLKKCRCDAKLPTRETVIAMSNLSKLEET